MNRINRLPEVQAIVRITPPELALPLAREYRNAGLPVTEIGGTLGMIVLSGSFMELSSDNLRPLAEELGGTGFDIDYDETWYLR